VSDLELQESAVKKLDFIIQAQEQSEWCWAAVTASIGNFYAGDDQLKQCDVVNTLLRRNDCCADGSSGSCNRQFDLDSALRRLEHFDRRQPGQPDFNVVVAEIDGGRPLAVRIRWSEGGGHAIVIYGFTDDRRVDIADPDHANDQILIPFDNFVYRDIGSWDDSLFTRS
jgi:hypothetical protein